METDNQKSSLAPTQWGRGIEGEGVFERQQPPPHPLPLSPESGGEGNVSTRVVAIARGWIGTPYVHQASLKHAGCDCLGLLRGIWRELYGEEPEEIPPYSLDWAEATGAETLYFALKRHADEIPLSEIAAGDIALFRMAGPSRATASLHERSRGPAKHCGVVASRESTSPFVGRSICRSEVKAIRLGDGAAEHSAPHNGGDYVLTLIHARQNKRVSEEPFSAFWRCKLAFAFRI